MKTKEEIAARRHAYYLKCKADPVKAERLRLRKLAWFKTPQGRRYSAVARQKQKESGWTKEYQQRYRFENKAKREALRKKYIASGINNLWQKSYARTPNGRLCAYKRDAKQRGIPFLLTKDQFLSFWQKPCHYCGSKIETVGLDRVNSYLGYTTRNVKSCCTACNRSKQQMTVENFLEHCVRILKHNGYKIRRPHGLKNTNNK